MINANLRHNRLISLNEFERLIASDFSAHENFFYKHSRGKHSKHYTSRVVYISFYTHSPYPASLLLIINKNTQQDTTKILNKMPQKCAMIR